MAQIDYKLKADVLKTDLPKKLNRLDRENYLSAIEGIVKDQELEDKYVALFNEFGSLYIKEARKINNASYRRIKRLRERIISYLQYPCVFLTLTFKEDVLNETNNQTRRKYVARFLKSITTHYIANVDYGTSTEREHYHAICVGYISKAALQDWDCKYGFTWIENIRHVQDERKLAQYISKLTNHAIKETTRRHVYIYSRD